MTSSPIELDDDEVGRLREEVAALQSRLEDRGYELGVTLIGRSPAPAATVS
ncbi:hypothetical protein [Actinoplanes subtropicus]|uniref:hypothetical protein n=1 Tax=Actinoplanes subtropicus TaxID=543632 RepID=UPI000AF7FB77|nr:hypothetical protein [Actinoplanes subtropicus]